MNILYSFINSLTITLGHDGSSANTLTIDPITTTQQQGHVDYTPIKVSGYTFKNQVATKNLQCDSIVYDQDLDLQVSQAVDLNKPEDLKFFRDKLNELRSLNNIYDLFFQDNEDEVEESILERKWYKFCGSAVCWTNMAFTLWSIELPIPKRYTEQSYNFCISWSSV